MAAQKDLGFDELRFAANLANVSTLRGMETFLRGYMIKPLEAEDLILFYRDAANRIFSRYPPRR